MLSTLFEIFYFVGGFLASIISDLITIGTFPSNCLKKCKYINQLKEFF